MVGKALHVSWSTLSSTLSLWDDFALFSLLSSVLSRLQSPCSHCKGLHQEKNNWCCRSQGFMDCIPCALIPILSQGPTPLVMSYCRCCWDPSPPWGEADAGCEVKLGILTVAECVPSFRGCALHHEARSAAGQHVHRATKKNPSAAEHTRAFVYSL